MDGYWPTGEPHDLSAYGSETGHDCYATAEAKSKSSKTRHLHDQQSLPVPTEE